MVETLDTLRLLALDLTRVGILPKGDVLTPYTGEWFNSKITEAQAMAFDMDEADATLLVKEWCAKILSEIKE